MTIDLGQSALDEEAEWHYLNIYKNGLPDHLVSTTVSHKTFSSKIAKQGLAWNKIILSLGHSQIQTGTLGSRGDICVNWVLYHLT